MREHLAFDLLVPVLTIALAMWIMPAGDVFQFSNDEGNQLAKARLLQAGYRMYRDIWSDQPPLHTVLLSNWLKLFGQSLSNARHLTLTLSSLLVWAFGRSVKATAGTVPALLSVLFLLLSSSYLQLSQSVMIGLPGLAFAMLSVYLLLRYAISTRGYWLAISGLLFGASMQIKLISIILIPPLCCYLLINRRSSLIRSAQQPADSKSPAFNYILTPTVWQPIAIWLGSVIVAFLIIGLAVGSFDWQQLVGGHIQAQSNHDSGWRYSRGLRPLEVILLQDYDYLLLVFVGLLVGITKLREIALLPLLWLASVILVFLYYRPLWGHYYPFLSIPMIWLGAFGIRFILSWWRSRPFEGSQRSIPTTIRQGLLASLLSLALLAPTVAIPVRIAIHMHTHEQFVERSQQHWEALAAIEAQIKPGDEWLLTDFPIYGFLSNLKVPPYLATVSSKRVNTGNLTKEDLQRILAEYDPAQVLIGRYPLFNQGLRPTLRQSHTVGYNSGGLVQFVKDAQAS
ncbi:MAG: glycosyltransferase family 39 protein [Synechococcus sp.]